MSVLVNRLIERRIDSSCIIILTVKATTSRRVPIIIPSKTRLLQLFEVFRKIVNFTRLKRKIIKTGYLYYCNLTLFFKRR